MVTLTTKRSNETYLEQNAIRLPYWLVYADGTEIGKMKADYKTMTQRTFSGVVQVNGSSYSSSGMRSMKHVLADLEIQINSEKAVDIQVETNHTEQVV
jgi:hypothetical protein